MDDADLTPQRPPLGPDEQPVADAVRRALAGRAPGPGLLAGVQRRAARRHRRRVAGGAAASALALAGLVAVVPFDGLVSGSGGSGGGGASAESAADAPAAAGSGGGDAAASADRAGPSASAPSDPSGLSATSLLTVEDVATLAPGARVVEPPAPVVTSQQFPSPPPAGGFCGDTVLEGVPGATESWSAAWEQGGSSASGFTASVRETVLRWDDAEAVTAYAWATGASPTRCGGPGDASSDQVEYQPLGISATAGAPTVLAVAPVEGAERGWRVRVVGTLAEVSAAVDLTILVEADTPDAAGARADGLFDAARARAVSTTEPSP